jgi:hypothetical protein
VLQHRFLFFERGDAERGQKQKAVLKHRTPNASRVFDDDFP